MIETTHLHGADALVMIAPQDAVGVAGTAWHQLNLVSGITKTNKETADQRYFDGSPDIDTDTEVATVSGGGKLEFGLDAVTDGIVSALAYGATVSAVANADGTFTQTLTPGSEPGLFSVYTRHGHGPKARRRLHMDCKAVSYARSADRDGQFVNGELELISARPGIVQAADPVASSVAERAFVATNAAGSHVIAGRAVSTVTEFGTEVQTGIEPFYSTDSLAPTDLIAAGRQQTVSATALADETGLTILDESIYGTANPQPGDEPDDTLLEGAFALELTRQLRKGDPSSTRSIAITHPRVQHAAIEEPDPNQSGLVTLSLGGTVEKPAAGPRTTITITSQHATTFDTGATIAPYVAP